MDSIIKKKEIYLIIVLVAISVLAHGINMFGFPYYENDEGTYISQAWSLINYGRLAPYTYWYDHAPAGWMIIALWVKLTGGFFTFGPSINSGRVLMLLFHAASTFFVYFICKTLTRSRIASASAVLLFSLTPIGIYFQRRVLLDNMMTAFILASFSVLLLNKLKLRHIIISALMFGIGVLIKENAIFFIFGFIILILQKASKKNITYAIALWLVISGSMISLYFLYALLKGEFFPAHTFLGGGRNHVSIIESLKYQLSRPGGSLLDLNSEFWQVVRLWIVGDKLLIIAGTLSSLIVFVISFFKRKYLPVTILALSFWYFLMRGGAVIEFYIIPLIPILAILIGILIHESFKAVSGTFVLPLSLFGKRLIPTGIGIYYILFGQTAHGFNIYFANQVEPQIEAMKWINENVPADQVVVIDDYAYVDMNDDKSPLSKKYVYSEWYWKVDRDVEIKEDLLKDDPSNIDVIAMTPQMDADLTQGSLRLLSASIKQSHPVKSFKRDGWGVEIWYSYTPKQILARSWESYKKNFIDSGGRIFDPGRDFVTTSEGQSYALLRSVYMDDRKTFDQVWSWTKNNMKNNQGLIGWIWAKNDKGVFALSDQGTASDGDTDIALALAFASKKWKDDGYLGEAKNITKAIWDNEVKFISGKPYMVAGNWAKSKDPAYINPSYLAPSAYRIFAQFDKERQWNQLADTSYDVLFGCSIAILDNKSKSAFIPPDWCATDGIKYEKVPENGVYQTQYSYDAFRTYFRVALDAYWFNNERAKNYLSMSSFIRDEWSKNGKVLTAYNHDGSVSENYESVQAYAGNIGNPFITDPKMAKDIYEKKMLPKFYENPDQSYWDDPKNYYTQNWAWFATALYTGNLKNLWNI